MAIACHGKKRHFRDSHSRWRKGGSIVHFEKEKDVLLVCARMNLKMQMSKEIILQE